MTSTETRLQDLTRQHPEWQPWLAVLRLVLNETANPEWAAAVPARPQTQNSVPLLAEAKLRLDNRVVCRLTEELVRVACLSGTPQMATLRTALDAPLDVFALFRSSLNQDRDRIKEIAVACGADPDAFQAVASLVALPFLHACNRHWARFIAPTWMEGYCPVCGAWPAFAEVRGIERSRHLRCGRCGSEWQSRGLICIYCGVTDHTKLVSLVPENSGSNSVIEACTHCRSYVKSFTTLQGSPPDSIILDDLASVELDIAAVEHGYKRPEGSGYFLDATVAENSAAHGLLA